jgi:hypothetical protein
VTLTLAMLGLTIRFATAGPAHDLATLSVVTLILYVSAFATGLGPVFWLLIAEIFPLRLRGLAMSRATCCKLGRQPGGFVDVPDAGPGVGSISDLLATRKPLTPSSSQKPMMRSISSRTSGFETFRSG